MEGSPDPAPRLPGQWTQQMILTSVEAGRRENADMRAELVGELVSVHGAVADLADTVAVLLARFGPLLDRVEQRNSRWVSRGGNRGG